MAKILIIHPDPAASEKLRRWLETDGHWVLVREAAEETPNRILSHHPDLLILNHADPVLSKNFIEKFRRTSFRPMPIILTVSVDSLQDIPALFATTGADGILNNAGLNTTELTNTVQNLLERPPGRKGTKRFLRYGHLELDRESRAVRLGSAMVGDLPQKLFDLLWLITRRAVETNEICGRQLIISKLWKTKVRDREVDVTVSRLKSRVPFLASFIETIPGKGYRFSLPSLSPKNHKTPLPVTKILKNQ